jgi:hypothetical protein
LGTGSTADCNGRQYYKNEDERNPFHAANIRNFCLTEKGNSLRLLIEK